MELSLLGDQISASALVRCKGSDVPLIYEHLNRADGVNFVSGEALERGET